MMQQRPLSYPTRSVPQDRLPAAGAPMSIDVACYGIVSPDPEEKTSAADQSYLRLSIRAGSADSVTWLTVKVFADVENLAGRLAKDSRVYIEGSLAADAWIDKEGKARPNLTVMCWRCVETHQIGRAKPPRERESKPKPASQSASPNDFYSDEIPF
jgi:single-stranded DNA-binding protein